MTTRVNQGGVAWDLIQIVQFLICRKSASKEFHTVDTWNMTHLWADAEEAGWSSKAFKELMA